MGGKASGKWSAALRSALKGCGLSLGQLAAASGVDKGRLSRFLRGERDLSLAAAEKVGTALGLSLVMTRNGKK